MLSVRFFLTGGYVRWFKKLDTGRKNAAGRPRRRFDCLVRTRSGGFSAAILQHADQLEKQLVINLDQLLICCLAGSYDLPHRIGCGGHGIRPGYAWFTG